MLSARLRSNGVGCTQILARFIEAAARTTRLSNSAPAIVFATMRSRSTMIGPVISKRKPTRAELPPCFPHSSAGQSNERNRWFKTARAAAEGKPEIVSVAGDLGADRRAADNREIRPQPIPNFGTTSRSRNYPRQGDRPRQFRKPRSAGGKRRFRKPACNQRDDAA
jgi:hypothetical protein